MDCTAGIAARGNRDDRAGGVGHQGGANKHTHAVVDCRNGEVHAVNEVVGAPTVVIATSRSVVGISGYAAVDNEEIANCRGDGGSTVAGA